MHGMQTNIRIRLILRGNTTIVYLLLIVEKLVTQPLLVNELKNGVI